MQPRVEPEFVRTQLVPESKIVNSTRVVPGSGFKIGHTGLKADDCLSNRPGYVVQTVCRIRYNMTSAANFIAVPLLLCSPTTPPTFSLIPFTRPRFFDNASNSVTHRYMLPIMQ